MEIGNYLFGNSRGNYELVDRRAVENLKEWNQLIQIIDDHGRGHYDGCLGEEFLNVDSGGFKNAVFEVNPYYWGECEDQYGHQEDGECTKCNIVDFCPLVRSNFVFYRDGFSIDWYKYPFRDSYTNRKVSLQYLKQVFSECLKSLLLRDKIWETHSSPESDFNVLDSIEWFPCGNQCRSVRGLIKKIVPKDDGQVCLEVISDEVYVDGFWGPRYPLIWNAKDEIWVVDKSKQNRY